MATWIFRIAGIYGLIVLVPFYFAEGRLTPALSHPEMFYGFLGVSVAWQLAFLAIATDPPRYRLLMLPAIAEKLGWTIALIVLHFAGRIPAETFWLGQVDWLWAALFVVAFLRTRASPA